MLRNRILKMKHYRGEQRLRKLISAAAFHLKGSGWYVTDFRDKDKKKANGKSEKEQSKSEASSEAKTDAKPAKKESKKKSSGAGDSA